MTVAGALALTGAALILLAAVGVLRLPDVWTRMHAATKAPTMGLICVATGVALASGDPVVAGKLALLTLFVAVTAPVGAHAIARAAYTRSAQEAELHVDEWRAR